VTGITGILTNSLQALDMAAPLIDTDAYLNYIQNLIKDIDPDTEALITDKTKEMYTKWMQAKLTAQAEQQGMDASILTEQPDPTEEEL
jgi:uncharacterized protein (DUF305 family)